MLDPDTPRLPGSHYGLEPLKEVWLDVPEGTVHIFVHSDGKAIVTAWEDAVEDGQNRPKSLTFPITIPAPKEATP